jgi:hypothetical protein
MSESSGSSYNDLQDSTADSYSSLQSVLQPAQTSVAADRISAAKYADFLFAIINNGNPTATEAAD